MQIQEKMDALSQFFKFLEELGIHVALIVAGMFGSILTIGNRKELNSWQKVLAVLSGGAIANYLTPVISDMVNINESTRYGFGFLLGFSGLEGVKWIILKIKSKHKDNL